MNPSITELHRLALAQGEGLGTAYEYFVKLRLLERALRGREIREVLIYGLPEKYGYGLDFLVFCRNHGAKAFLFEEREERVGRMKRVVAGLIQDGHQLSMPTVVKRVDRPYDAIMSCEALQAVADRKAYARKVLAHGRMVVVFVPNSSNKAHSRISGLLGLTEAELRGLFGDAAETGYIDMPPFPPGARSGREVQNRVIIRMLAFYALLENYLPFKKWFAHICYASIEKIVDS
jgi:hypothetical protein